MGRKSKLACSEKGTSNEIWRHRYDSHSGVADCGTG